ncbi:uncharacterized protein B0H18DRAFT_280149 [Fomitopsis serialis]|uniref:uncharacterized protein n=1 Tax=Fomitopsis serialis TaxID=139415 RepID=UPI002007A261|nr:uncharacterized protein B0H18DRAFT_280149 [Neoantrodia serialis]KAH9927591.1 hypothetical protein B0H18DRAFT_280149 [Neoantrodia serialis]
MATQATRYWNLLNSPWWATLISCALTCKTLYNRARWHLRGNVVLSNRGDVVLFQRQLRDNPYLRPTMRFVTIVGAPDGQSAGPIPHLGTFAIMLSRYLTKAETLVINNAKWGAGSVRPGDIANLAAFRSISELTLDHVCFATVSQLTQLMSALPKLRNLFCKDLTCDQNTPVLSSLPLNSTQLRDISLWGCMPPAVHDFILRIAKRADLRTLDMGVHFQDIFIGAIDIQKLLRACAPSLRDFGLSLNLNGVIDKSPDKICQKLDISFLEHLTSLRLSSWCFLEDKHSWIPYMLSSLGTYDIPEVQIHFHIGRDDRDERLSALLYRLDTEDELADIDKRLSQHKFSSIKPDMLEVGLAFSVGGCSPYEVLRVSEDEWAKLVRGKMPLADKRGILRTTVFKVC